MDSILITKKYFTYKTFINYYDLHRYITDDLVCFQEDIKYNIDHIDYIIKEINDDNENINNYCLKEYINIQKIINEMYEINNKNIDKFFKCNKYKQLFINEYNDFHNLYNSYDNITIKYESFTFESEDYIQKKLFRKLININHKIIFKYEKLNNFINAFSKINENYVSIINNINNATYDENDFMYDIYNYLNKLNIKNKCSYRYLLFVIKCFEFNENYIKYATCGQIYEIMKNNKKAIKNYKKSFKTKNTDNIKDYLSNFMNDYELFLFYYKYEKEFDLNNYEKMYIYKIFDDYLSLKKVKI